MMLAKKFQYLMMDELAALAARLIAAGAAFWCERHGGVMTVAHSGTVVTLPKRQAQQVCGLLGVRQTVEVQRLDRAAVHPRVLAMVLEDIQEVLEAARTGPLLERAGLGQAT